MPKKKVVKTKTLWARGLGEIHEKNLRGRGHGQKLAIIRDRLWGEKEGGLWVKGGGQRKLVK